MRIRRRSFTVIHYVLNHQDVAQNPQRTISRIWSQYLVTEVYFPGHCDSSIALAGCWRSWRSWSGRKSADTVGRDVGTSEGAILPWSWPRVLSEAVDVIIRVLDFLIHDDNTVGHTSRCPTSSFVVCTGCALSPRPNCS